MALAGGEPHAPGVPLGRDNGGGRPVQRGLPGVAAEEARLPSEQVLRGDLLTERRREALAGLRRVLGERPEGFAVDEWRVVLATLAPVSGGGLAGAAARTARAAMARECFPGLPAPAALRRLLEVSALPHVAEVIADFRALEMADILEQRSMLREVLYGVLGLGEGLKDLMEADPCACAKMASAVVQAAKALMDLDGLRAPKPTMTPAIDLGEDAGNAGGKVIDAAADTFATLREKVSRIAADISERAAEVVTP